MNKLLVLVIASILLGGCTLNQYFGKGDAARDSQLSPSPSLVATPTTSPEPSLGTGTDESSIELDLDATIIEKEDFSDLD